MARYALGDRVDVCIIGSGAGGGTLAKELTRRGVKVVLLEAGPRLIPEKDFENDEWTMFSKISWLDTRESGGRDGTPLPAWIVKAVGGTTIHFAGASIRFQPHEWRAKTTYGAVPGANLEDWPITADEMLPYYKQAEAAMGVAGVDRPNPPHTPNTNFLVMKRGAEKVGLHPRPGFMAINSVPYDGRPACIQCGFCFQGCVPRAKWSTLYEAIPKAEATGLLDLRPSSQALKLTLASADTVRGVLYVDDLGRTQEQLARAVVVAGNSIETPRLLLNSWTPSHPQGLANASGQVGKNYMRHVTGSVYGQFPKPVHAYKGITMMGIVSDFEGHDEPRGFAGGFHLETLFLGAPFMAFFVKPGWWGPEFADWMDHYDYLAGMWIVGEDLPQAQNSVTLHPEIKDRFGLPVPLVSYTDHALDRRMRQFAYEKGKAIYEAAGATRVVLTPPYPATHNLGTCRMGHDPSTSVVDRFGKAHELKNLYVCDGSVFTTSAAENPTLTIVALAIRQGEHLAGEMKKGNL